MARRRWSVCTEDQRNFSSTRFITLKQLQPALQSLKEKGDVHDDSIKWTSPIIPLLMEFVFTHPYINLDSTESFTLHLNKGKDLSL